MSGARVLAIVTDAWGAEGGIAQYNRDFLAALAASPRVERVDVIAYTNADRASPSLESVMVREHRSRSVFAARCLRDARGHEVVFCGHLHLAPVAALAARRARAPLWLQVHGIEAWERPARWRRAACEEARLITAVSRYTRARVCAWARNDPTRVRVLPNTVDVGLFNGSAAQVAAAPVILSVGRLASGERYKGHDRVIRLLPQLRAAHSGLRYRIVGDGDDRERLVSLAASMGVADAVDFVGHVPRKDLPREMASATVFAMPSTGEGFGIAYIEAMACGTPAVGLDGDGSRDALGDGALGIVSSADRLFEALDGAISHPSESQQLSRLTQDRFSPARFRSHVDLLLGEVLAA